MVDRNSLTNRARYRAEVGEDLYTMIETAPVDFLNGLCEDLDFELLDAASPFVIHSYGGPYGCADGCDADVRSI